MDTTFVGKRQLVKRQVIPLASKIVRWQSKAVSQTLADRIKIARKAKGFGIVQLDLEAGVSQGTVTRYEKGERGVGSGGDGGTLRKLAKALGVRLEWLMSGEEPMSEQARDAGPLPRRTEGARLAREAGVFEQAIESVLEEPPSPGDEHHHTLWWADKMRLRERELVARSGEHPRATQIPAPPPSTPPVSTSRPTPPPSEPAKPKRKTGRG